MTPTMTLSVPTDGLNTVAAVLISIVVLLCVALAMVLLGIVLFLTLRRKTVSGKQAAPAIGVDTISGIYDEVDEGKTGTAVALRSVGNLQTITEPDPTYEAIDDSELDSKCKTLCMNVPTASNPAYGVTTTPSSDVPTDSNPAYGVTTNPALGIDVNMQQLSRANLNEEEDYI